MYIGGFFQPMITKKQAEARRENGALSHGPKTPEGKAICSQNAVKFGFFSRDPLLPGEDAEAFAEFRSGLLAALDPSGSVENMLAAQIIGAAWRLRRFPAVEASVVESRMWEAIVRLSRYAAVRLQGFE